MSNYYTTYNCCEKSDFVGQYQIIRTGLNEGTGPEGVVSCQESMSEHPHNDDSRCKRV